MNPRRICLIAHVSEISADQTVINKVFHKLRRVIEQHNDQLTIAYASDTGILVVHPANEDLAASTFLPPPDCPYPLEGPDYTRAAYHTFLWLKSQSFDGVYATGTKGILYYALTARCQGIAFEDTFFCILLLKPSLLQCHEAQRPVSELSDLISDHLERTVCRLADRTVTNTQPTLDWVSEHNWILPHGIHFMMTHENPVKSGNKNVKNSPGSQGLHADLSNITNHKSAHTAQALNAATPIDKPLVTVCITHYNRPQLLQQAITSIEAQSYPTIEIIVVDDASDSPEAIAALEQIENKLNLIGGAVIRHPSNRYLGAARNTAAAHAHGKYILFLDDDDYAKSNQVATLVDVAERCEADIVNSFCDRFAGLDPPGYSRKMAIQRWLMLGNAPTVGLFRNYFGPASALILRTSFEKTGGFTEHHGIGHEDWEFFARASLNGLHLEIIPEALFWYRDTPNSMLQTINHYHSNIRNIAPYLSCAPGHMKLIVTFAVGLEQTKQKLNAQIRRNTDLQKKLNTAQEKSHEFDSLVSVILPSGASTPEEALRKAQNAQSWRITAPLRSFVKKKHSTKPVSSYGQAAHEILSMQQNIFWEIAAPIRVFGRILRQVTKSNK